MGVRKSKYNSLAEWKKADPKAYDAAHYQGLLTIICEKFGWKIKFTKGYWSNKNLCFAEAIKYNSPIEWATNHQSSFQGSKKYGWYKKCIKHMTFRKSNGYWDDKINLLIDSKKYKSRREWKLGNQLGYNKARKYGWFEECTKHMVDDRKPKGFWLIKSNVLSDAKNYKTKSEWKSSSGRGFASAKENGWFEECTKHMINGYKKK